MKQIVDVQGSHRFQVAGAILAQDGAGDDIKVVFIEYVHPVSFLRIVEFHLLPLVYVYLPTVFGDTRQAGASSIALRLNYN